jgi:hypothetical protein
MVLFQKYVLTNLRTDEKRYFKTLREISYEFDIPYRTIREIYIASFLYPNTLNHLSIRLNPEYYIK